MDEDAVQTVEMRFGSVRGLVQEFLEVDFEGELVSIVNLEMGIKSSY
jgi:hypothetical protein